jgi:NAD(P)-dependent dehydrogenase (short-subunit alcohol dehydrogenase family)
MRPIEQMTVLVTGASDGLGRHVAGELAAAGAVVLLHSRDPERGRQLLDQIQDRTDDDRHRLYLADFSSLNEVHRLADQVTADNPRLDVLINNAGIGTGGLRDGQTREFSRDGHELRFQVNYLAAFMLTTRLLGLLRRSAPARVVNVASAGQAPIDFDDLALERGYSGVRAYGQSKLALIMFTFELAERLAGARVTATALHPATFMDTTMVRQAGVQPISTVEQGAEATLRLAVDPGLDGVTGTLLRRHAGNPGQRPGIRPGCPPAPVGAVRAPGRPGRQPGRVALTQPLGNARLAELG